MPELARVGDTHNCPKHGSNTIAEGGSAEIDGRKIARVGDTCACGGVILLGSSLGELDGRPIALVGSKTSCGGVISSGAAKRTIAR